MKGNAVTAENHLAAPSFDRMRNMLVRAAEVRESEQQQIFDALDDIYARLAPVDSLGAVRKRLADLPDRTEVGVLAERLDEAMSRMEAQDNVLAELGRAVESIVDKLAKPFGQLDGRLDGVAARFEGVAGRMDGLEDKLANIHRRIDELGSHLDKQDDKMDGLPPAVHGPVRERIDTLESGMKERAERLEADAKNRLESTTETLRTALQETAEAVDASERLDSLRDRLDQVNSRIEELAGRLDKVEEGVASQLGDLDGALQSRLSKVDATLSDQPDNDYLTSVVNKSNEESERRIGGQLDEAMATFAELMLGGSPAQQSVAIAPPAPRQPQRRRNGRTQKNTDGKSKAKASEESGSDD